MPTTSYHTPSPHSLPRVWLRNSARLSCFFFEPFSRTVRLFFGMRRALPPPRSPQAAAGSRAEEISHSLSGPQESRRQMVHNFRMCSALAGSVVNSNPMGGPEPSPLRGEGRKKTDGVKYSRRNISITKPHPLHILELLLSHTHWPLLVRAYTHRLAVRSKWSSLPDLVLSLTINALLRPVVGNGACLPVEDDSTVPDGEEILASVANVYGTAILQ